MAFNYDDDEEGKDISDINIVPLVDVMLVLLIIFMIAAAPSLSGIDVNLPLSKVKGAKIMKDRIVLSIDSGGKIYIEKSQVPKRQLQAEIKKLFEHREHKELYIRADRSVDYGHVVDAMNAAKLAGVARMSMLTKPPKNVADLK